MSSPVSNPVLFGFTFWNAGSPRGWLMLRVSMAMYCETSNTSQVSDTCRGSRSLVLMQVAFVNISTPGVHLVPAYQVLQYDAVKWCCLLNQWFRECSIRYWANMFWQNERNINLFCGVFEIVNAVYRRSLNMAGLPCFSTSRGSGSLVVIEAGGLY